MARSNVLPDALLSVLIGAFLVLFGLREAIPALILQPTHETLETLRDQQQVPPPALDRLVEAENSALSIHETAADWSNLALALVVKAANDSAGGKEMLEEARQSLRLSLQQAPANPYAWLRLAEVEKSLSVDNARALAYWRMSLLTGPNENRLKGPRFALGIAMWPDISNDDRDAIMSDIRAVWHQDQAVVLALANDNFTANVIRGALVVELKDLMAFEKQFKAKQK